MSGSMNIPGVMNAAQAASFFKGQEKTRENSKEKQEELNLLRKALVDKKLNPDKVTETNKNFLA